MSKNYDEISNQCAVVKVDGRTLSVYPNLKIASRVRYGECWDSKGSKIKFSLQDYTEGKGDNSIFCNFNLDMKDYYFLYEKAKMSHLPSQYYITKIVGKPEATKRDGQFQGLNPVSRLTISRTPKTSTGAPMRMPWKIHIANGYAKALNGKKEGTYYEAKDSFKLEKESAMMLTDADFQYIFEKIHDYMEMYKMICWTPVFKAGLQDFVTAENNRENRNTYAPNLNDSNNQESDETVVDDESVVSEETEPEATQMSLNDIQQPSQETAQQNKIPSNTPDLHQMTMVINSDFQYMDGNSAVAQCIIGGKAYVVNFPDVDEALTEAQQKKLAIKCNLYADKNKQMHFYNMAS